jgi:hypothetical protein
MSVLRSSRVENEEDYKGILHYNNVIAQYTDSSSLFMTSSIPSVTGQYS